ncbi:MAG: methionine synthase [Candidatus Melainabacteria bacterium]|nr:methionine synthase [Candidatus Melainabacteria bacterium]
MTQSKFLERLKERVLIFDGAMGTSIHTYDLTLDDYAGYENCPEILVESRPDVIQEIHESFFKVGCDVVETDTFGGSPIVLAEFDLVERTYELNKKAAELAREVASSYSKDKPRFVSGSIGPTTKLPSLGHITFADMKDAYYEQIRGLVDGGVDVLQFETGQDLLQAKAAVIAMLDYFKVIGRRVPIITQVTIEAPPLGTMLVGSDISCALTTLAAYPIDIIGINCATGPSEMLDPVRYLCDNTEKYISVLPNAGLPENVNGETVYKLTPDQLAASLLHFVSDDGVNIVGGCCGTTPAHLAKVVEVIGDRAPKKRNPTFTAAAASIYTSVPLSIDQPPLIIGERTNTNGSRKFKRLLEKEDWDGMVAMARDQEREGAHVLDVCTAYVGRDEKRDMTIFIKRLNTELQIPIVVDTTEYPVLAAALEFISGKAIVNSINLEDGVENMMKKVALITRFGAAAVALTIDEAGMAKDAEKKVAIAKRIHDLAAEGGLPATDLIFDALTFTLSTGNEDDRKLGLETLKAIKMIKEQLPGVKTVLGVSNISFGFDPHIRQILNSVFLHYAVEYGLDLAIVNAQKILPLYKIEEDEREYHRKLIFDERTESYDPLFALLDYYKEKLATTGDVEEKVVSKEIEEVLKVRIIDGNRVGLEKDLKKALEKYAPLAIINDLLLDGMKVVGELFGSGKMQLPFVLQSAETMKAAVAFLEPRMEKSEGTQRGTMVLATVKGDVHDIGKNLVDIILTNNGYKVINLGIKQPIENIISSAIENKADCIGMSGLLVKSTVIMKDNLDVLNQREISVPVILGGAALTRRYVEEDCRKVYKGMTFYGSDAFDDLKIMEALAAKRNNSELATLSEEGLMAAIHGAKGKDHDESDDDSDEGSGNGKQKNAPADPDDDREITSEADVRELAAAAQPTASPEEEVPTKVASCQRVSRTPAAHVDTTDNGGEIIRSDVARKMDVPTPPFFGSKIVDTVALGEVFEYINQNVLFKGQWRVRQGNMPKAEYDDMIKAKFLPVYKELRERCIKERLLIPRAVYGYFHCQSSGNDLIVYRDDQKTEWLRFSFPRQNHGKHLCISDFFRSTEEGMDVVALQVVTMGAQASEYAQDLFKSGRYADYLYFHGLSVESAEGLAEVIHKRVRTELGYAAEDAANKNQLFQQGYRGTRYSFGYPACPNLEDQQQLFELLEPERVGIILTEEYQLVPEQSTSAIVVHHPEAKYFNIASGKKAVTTQE